MNIIIRKPWKKYRRIKDIPTNKDVEISAYAVIGAIVLCGIILAVAVFRG